MRISRHHRVRKKCAGDRTDEGADRRDGEAVGEGRDDEGLVDRREVGQIDPAGRVDERARCDDPGGQEKEQPDVDAERNDPEPRERKPPPALQGASGGCVYSRRAGCRPAMAADQCELRYAKAAVAWSLVGICGVPLTDGSAAAAALSIDPADCMAAIDRKSTRLNSS